MSEPVVSVLIAAYNEEERIRDSLDSVFAQTYSNLEVIVVDDGSTDATAEIVRSEYPDVILVRQENAGLPATRNAAAGVSSGELLMAMDADDRIAPEKVERQIEVLRQHPEAAAVATNGIAQAGRHTYPYTNPRLDRITETDLHAILCGPSPVGASTMIRREAFEDIGGYDPEAKLWDDRDFFCRLILQGHRLLFLNEPLYFINHHPDNISSKSFVTRARYYVTGYRMLDPRRTDLPWRSPLTEAEYSWYLTERVILACFRSYRQGDREAGMEFIREIDQMPAPPIPARALRAIAGVSWPAFGVAAIPYYLWLRGARTRRVWGLWQGLQQIWRRFIR
ncbi:MAG: glycosyltransferase family 2 protein [Armatimonadota bacterium]